MGCELSHVITCGDILLLDGLAAFYLCHGGKQAGHLVLIEEIEIFLLSDAGELADSANIRNAIVL